MLINESYKKFYLIAMVVNGLKLERVFLQIGLKVKLREVECYSLTNMRKQSVIFKNKRKCCHLTKIQRRLL